MAWLSSPHSALAAGLFAVTLGFFPNAGEAADGAFGTFIEPLFQQHCVRCHGENEKVKGKVDLLAIEDLTHFLAEPDLIGEIIEVIEFEEMPPEDEPQPSAQERQQLLDELEGLLERALNQSQAPPYAPSPLRRMNRFQYSNAVRDLFELEPAVFSLPEQMMREYGDYFQPASGVMPEVVGVGSRPLGKSQLIEKRLAGVAPFPQDLRAEHGFDNRGDHLSLSPLLLESFLKLSRSIVESPDFTPRHVGIWEAFFAEPDTESEGDLELVVRARLDSFLHRAFRRTPDPSLLDRYASHALGRIAAGESYTAAMKAIASAAIASPRFLYLYDRGTDTPGAESLDDSELASRLSFFLWGSIPDRELLDLATAGRLSDPIVLEQQISRMLTDRKLKRFCDSFPSQWLQLERIISSNPDKAHFPDFYFSKYRNSMHMMLEPLLLFEAVLIENRSVLDLIDPDFTYRSDRLHSVGYGEKLPPPELGPNGKPIRKRGGNAVTQLKFHRMPVTDRRYGGIITNAAVMTMTSGPEHTHPITRGAWLATVIFNNPPPPPPADVPPLSEKPGQGEETLTLRERLSAHRERQDCAGCHDKLDPLGFALENYDPVGRWRDHYENGREVDMSGKLLRKHTFDDVLAFKDAILAEKDRFTRGLAGHLLSFATARELDAADKPALDLITAATAADGYRLQTLITQVILSEPFLSKSNPRAPEAVDLETAHARPPNP